MARKPKSKQSAEPPPKAEPIDSSEEEEEDEDEDESHEEESHDDNDDSESESVADSDFESQGSSSSDEDRLARQAEESDDDSSFDGVEILDVDAVVDAPRVWKRDVVGRKLGVPSGAGGDDETDPALTSPEARAQMHTDDLSSDDEDPDGTANRIGRVPLHWYDDYDHVGYDAHGSKVAKSSRGDLLDDLLTEADRESGKFVVYDALNARNVELTERQVTLLRRMQGGAFAHPEHEAHPDYVDYFSGVPEVSGINSNRYEKKSRFQPSKYEKLQVRRLLHRLKCGSINMDFLEGKVRDMNDLVKREEGDKDKPFLLWKGDEEDELALRKGPQHIAPPKQPPPGHAHSYNPPEEYLPSKEELEEWKEMDPEDRPYGHFVPQKFDNLRSVGAYQHAVKERFERCLDLYLCPRVMKRRLNIDPESLVPRLPRASDLRPFPTAKCVEYVDGESGDCVVRCLSVSPEGQFVVSGGEDGVVRLWEVQTGRLVRKWDLAEVVDKFGEKEEDGKSEEEDAPKPKKPITSIEWNPNRTHHCLLVGIGKCAVILATGTGGIDDAEVTEALLSEALSVKGGGNISPESRAAKAVKWISLKKRLKQSSSTPISAFGGAIGPIAILQTNKDVSHVRWHRKGDYFVTVSPKAGAAAVLIHQLSKAASQQPFGKTKGEVQLACFHPQKPFLFVASKEHVRVYHLVKQVMVKRLMSGCRHISSLDVHGSGDHLVVGSLDRRLVWFDLDLASTPYKTLKYHERALRSVGFHPRYPLMASASDDGSIHVFHSMVYSDLMRNPLIVPVKVLRGHAVVNSLGALAMVFHPTQPWLFSAGADGKIHLFQDL
jgi:ribosome biogenesis protein ERB1